MDRWDLFVWVLAPAGSLAAIAATAVCWLKGKRAWGIVGVIASMLAVTVMVSSWTADSASFEDLAMAFLFLYVVVPLTIVTVAGATQRPRPGSWWARRRPDISHRATALPLN